MGPHLSGTSNRNMQQWMVLRRSHVLSSVTDISTPDLARDRDQRGTTGTGASVDRDWVPLISCLVCQTVSGLREAVTGGG